MTHAVTTSTRSRCTSYRTIRRLDASGRLPEPVRIGGRAVRGRRAEIVDWIAEGCPDRAMWIALSHGDVLRRA